MQARGVGRGVGLGVVFAIVSCFGVLPAVGLAQKQIGGFVGDPSGTVRGGQFGQPRDVAVNLAGAGAAEPGDVYVSEFGTNRVQVLDADGNFKFLFGRDVIVSGASGDLGDVFEICTVATDCKQGSVGTFVDGPGGEFMSLQGVAVDQVSGRVYTQERSNSTTGTGQGNRRIQEFAADGTFLRAWGWDVVASGPGNTGGFEVCVAADGDVCQAATAGGFAGGQFANLGGAASNHHNAVAVSSVNGRLFVGDPGNRRVMEFDPAASGSAVFVGAWGWDVDKTTVDNRFEFCTANCGAGVASDPAGENGAFGSPSPLHIAIDSRGVVYAADNGVPSVTAPRVVRFDPGLVAAAGNATASLLVPVGVPPLLSAGSSTPTVGLEIDADSDGAGPDEESLLVVRDPASDAGDPTTVVQELDIPTEAGELPTDAVTVVGTHTFAAATPAGIGVNSANGSIFLPGVYSTPGTLQGLFVLAEAAGVAEITADSPAVVGAESATLAGTIDPNGVASFEIELAKGGGGFVPVGSRTYVSGGDPLAILREVSGLDPNSFYRYRIRVTKRTGFTTSMTEDSNEQIFLTAAKAPDVATLGSAERTASSVQLRGLVDANGSDTSYRFEYGPAGGSFDRHVPVPDALAGSGQGDQLVVQAVSGLVADSAYRYRIVATNAVGSTFGDPVGFRTAAVGPDVPVPAARAFELVSPADKVAGIGVGPWYGGPGAASYAGKAAYRGERFAAMGDFGSMLVGDGAQGYVNDWAFAERAGDQAGWTSHSPVTHAASGPQDYRWINMSQATPDLSRVIWRSNGGLLRPFAEMGDWTGPIATADPPFIGDWAGRWEIFGPTDPTTQLIAPDSGGLTYITESALSDDGSTVVGSTDVIRGLAGPGDPTLDLPAPPNRDSAPENVYVGDVSGGPADTLAGTGARELANVCSAGTEIPAVAGGVLGVQGCVGGGLISPFGAVIQAGGLQAGTGISSPLDGVVSDDGGRVFFMAPDPGVPGVPDGVSGFCSGAGVSTVCPAQLFVRVKRGDGSVVVRWISRSRSEDRGEGRYGGAVIAGQQSSLLGEARFEGASSDGDKVFFRTSSPLTPDDPNGGGSPVSGGVTSGAAHQASWDLYMYDLPDDPEADPGDGTLTRITAGPSGVSDPNGRQNANRRQGVLRFVSDDGQRAYFVTAGSLAGVPTPGSGSITMPGGTPNTADRSNLYVYDGRQDAGERWRFIARLPRATGGVAAACATTSIGAGSPLTAAQPASTHVVDFLNGNPSCVRGSGDGGFVTFFTDGRLTGDDPDGVSGDIYGYEAVGDRLVRLTRAQGGVGGSYPCGTGGTAAATPCHGDNGFDAAGDGYNRISNPGLGVATVPAVVGDRVAFFQSRARLVVEDTDDAYDVYQWRNGELSLLTPGDSAPGDGQMYKGNDETGRNVYFATRDRLSWQDFDAVLDVYTARVGGGIAEPDPPVVCVIAGGGCHGGGSVAVETSIQTGSPVEAPSEPAARRVLGVAVGAKARRAAARSGVLAVRVRSSTAGRVTVAARGRVGRRWRPIGSGALRLQKAGVATVRVRLGRTALGQLRRGRPLAVRVTVRAAGARPRTISVRLAGRSR